MKQLPRPSPIKQARKFCLRCCCGNLKTIRFCCDLDCPLWFLRFGTYPTIYVKQKGKDNAKLFDKDNFKAGSRYDPAKCVEDMEL